MLLKNIARIKTYMKKSIFLKGVLICVIVSCLFSFFLLERDFDNRYPAFGDSKYVKVVTADSINAVNDLEGEGGNYVISGLDAYFILDLQNALKNCRGVIVRFRSAIESSGRIQIFWGKTGEDFSEIQSCFRDFPSGSTEVVILTDNIQGMKFLRVDVDAAAGTVFEVEHVLIDKRSISFADILKTPYLYIILAVTIFIWSLFCYLEKTKEKWKNRYCIYLVVVVSVIFALLYYNLVFREFAYIYGDVGSDTLNQYWPRILFNLQFGENVGNGGYTLQKGLGEYVWNAKINYYTPFDWCFLCMPVTTALIVSLYLKMIWTAVFSWAFFKTKFTKDITAFVAALIWTFSGYMILWGQHYEFATFYAYVTAVFFFVERMLQEKKYVIFLPLFLALLTGCSYYITYMLGIAIVIYILFYGIKNKWHLKKTLLMIVKLGLAEMFAVLLSMVRLYPALYGLFQSSRGNEAAGILSMLLDFRGIDYLLCYIGRMVSVDFWGCGNAYTGYLNYYEMAIPSLSILSFFSIAYYMSKENWKKIAIGIVLCCFSICAAFVSYVLTFLPTFRWTFLINFMVCILIASCINDIVENKGDGYHDANIYKAVIRTDILLLIIIGTLLWSSKACSLTVDGAALRKFVIVWIMGNILAVILYLMRKRSTLIIHGLLLVFLIVEIVIQNYSCINERVLMTKQQAEEGLYNDGTPEVVSLLGKADDSLYRINKTYDSIFYNDAYVQGYNGMASYISEHSGSVINLLDSLDIKSPLGHVNYIRIGVNETIVNELLGVKYVIASVQDVLSDNYEECLESGNFVVYKDSDSLPFGYLYHAQMDKTDFNGIEDPELRKQSLMMAFYMTEENADSHVKKYLLTEQDIAEDWNAGREILKGTDITSIGLSGNEYSAFVKNDEAETAMLCVPLLYDKNWTVQIDGQEQVCYDINGGLVGVEIPKGSHQVKLVYNNSMERVTQYISMASLFVWGIWMAAVLMRKRIKND